MDNARDADLTGMVIPKTVGDRLKAGHQPEYRIAT
jgi:hypothetical protein